MDQPLNSALLQQRRGPIVGCWLDHDDDINSTRAYLIDGAVWIVKEGIGTAIMRKHSDIVQVYPDVGVSEDSVQFIVTHQWQPLLYQALGTQVMHASAAYHLPSKTLLTFSGPSCSGKSTGAYGLAQRDGWIQIADDFIGFKAKSGEIEVVQLSNLLRLRPDSARHFATNFRNDRMVEAVSDFEINRAYLVMLHPLTSIDASVHKRRLKAAEALIAILAQAYTITTDDSNFNREMMRAYLEYIERIPVIEFTYHASFEKFERMIDLVEETAFASC